MTDHDKSEYAKIVSELRAMSRRLAELAEAGYSDMEGADSPEFFISEELWGLEEDARKIFGAADQIEIYIGK